MVQQTHIFENETSGTMEVYVEAYPDRYLLKPQDIMKIVFDHEGDGPGLHTIIHKDGGLQIYIENFDSAVVSINGVVTEPWSQ